MYFKLIIFLAIFILGGFFYLHVQNPVDVQFALSGKHSYALPPTLILFVGFTIGVVITVINSLVIDAVKGLKGIKTRRQMRQLAEAQDNYRKGVETLASGELEGARHFLEKAVNIKPDDAGMVISLSETYVREGRLKEALDVLENGVLKSPGSAALHLAIAKSSDEAGDLLKASRSLEDVLRLDPGNPYALKKLRDIKVKDGAWAEAVELQRKALGNARSDDAIRREKKLLAAMLYEEAAAAAEAGRFDEAVNRLKESLKSYHAFMPSDILFGEIRYRQGKVVDAIMTLEESLGKYRSPYPILLLIEDFYIKKSAPDKAIDRYQKEIYTRPGDIRIRQLLARLYLRLEMAGKAVDELERLYAESEEDYYTRVLMGEAYMRTNEVDKAAIFFSKALEIERDLPPPFACTACGVEVREWAPRCEACGEWNTLDMGTGRCVVV